MSATILRRVKVTSLVAGAEGISYEGYYHGAGVASSSSTGKDQPIAIIEREFEGRGVLEPVSLVWYRVEFLSPPEDTSWAKRLETVLWEINSSLLKVWSGGTRP